MEKKTAIQLLREDIDTELKYGTKMVVNWDMYLETEKEQIKDAWLYGFKSSAEGWNGEMLPHYEDGKQTIDEYKEEYYNETYGKAQ